MTRVLVFLLMAAAASGQEYKMAVVGLVHSHVWGHLQRIVAGKQVQLVGVAEPNAALVAEARKLGVADELFAADYRKMLDEKKPQIVWAFVENNRHLEIVQACAPRRINVIFEKPLAATYAQAVEIQKLAKQHGIQVMSNYQMAWWPANYTAKKLTETGELGQVWRLHGVVGHGGPGSDGVRNGAFFSWLTDPEKNGAGALMDFGCYNALWSLWYLGRPETVYAHVNHLRPETFPKVEDNADLVLGYKNGVGMFEGSWDLPRSMQEVEVFGLKGSVLMQNGKVTERIGRETKEVAIAALPVEESEPVAYMVSRLRQGKQVEGLTALEINVGVVEIIEAAKKSVASGQAIRLSQNR